MIFDLLYLDGHTTMGLPYRERRALLEELELNGPAWQTPAYHPGEGRELLAAAAEQHLEGVVAKRLDSPYRPGRRTDEWLKVKNVNRQELVIGGWLPGKGAARGAPRSAAGGLRRARRESSAVLRYAGRVGTGFNEDDLERLGKKLATIRATLQPFRRQRQPPRGAQLRGAQAGGGDRVLATGPTIASSVTPPTRDCARTSLLRPYARCLRTTPATNVADNL